MTTEVTTIDCPMCGEEIKSIAKKCKHCGEFLNSVKKAATTLKEVTCQTCGETTKVDSGSCEHCNEPLTSAISTHLDTIKTAFLRNKYLWGMVIWAILMCFVEAFIGPYLPPGRLFFFHIAGFYILEVLDSKDLKKKNLEIPSGWVMVLIPVYLWKRLTVTNEKRTIFWSWIVSVVVATIIAESSANHVHISWAARKLINENIKSSDIECVDVIELDEYASDHYRAKAVLSTGDEEDITIRVKNGNIYVKGK